MKKFDVIIIGAGAAGLMCAIEAGKRGRKVLVLDHNSKPAEKIRISGGGRCNFTNLDVKPENFISQNPRFCISALSRFTQHDFIKLVEKHKIKYHEKTLGQLFCDESAKLIINLLLNECDKNGVEISLETKVDKVEKNPSLFSVFTSLGKLECESLVIATGGLSIPKMGATDFGYQIARQFGINIIAPRAGLVPFVFEEGQMLSYVSSMAGTSLNVQASVSKTGFKEAMLFTHRGLSGPAILQISSYWNEGEEVKINLSPDLDVFEFLVLERNNNPKQSLQNTLAKILPKKLAAKICESNYLDKKLADYGNKKFQQIAGIINNWQIKPDGTEGYRTAEVTIGGVDTNELSSKTFEAKKVEGLYFIGEVVDVTGWLGGYNFQWAWSSGHACGQFA